MDTIKDMDQARQHDLTIEEVKGCPLFAHLSDEEARQVIDTIKKFTVIVFNFYQKNNKKALTKD